MGANDLISLSTYVNGVPSGVDVTLGSVAGLVPGDQIIIESQHGYNETGLDGDWPISNFPIAGNYYTNVDHVGKSYIGTISAINGNVLTMTTPVPAASNGLPAFRNNAVSIKYAIENKVRWPEQKVLAAATTNTSPIRASLTDDYHEIDFNGCTILSPRGVCCVMLSMVRVGGGGVSNKRYRNLILKGNARPTGYGISAETGVSVQGSSFSAPFSVSGTSGANPTIARFVDIENFKIIDCWRSIGHTLAQDCNIVDCVTEPTDILKNYIQWEYLPTSCERIAYLRCKVQSAFHRAGFEPFRCQGVTFDNCYGRNANMSVNTSGGVLYRNCTIDWDQVNPEAGEVAATIGLLNIGRTIETQAGSAYEGTQGGTGIRNFTINQNVVPYPGTNSIFASCLIGAGIYGIDTAADIRGLTINLPGTDHNCPHSGYAVRADASETYVSGLVCPQLTGKTKYVKNNVPQPDPV